MKLVIVLSIAALVSCDYPAAQPEAPSESYGVPNSNPVDEVEEQNAAPSSAPIDTTKSLFSFQNFYKGAFPPSTFPHINFLSQYPTYPSQFPLKYPLKSFNYLPSQVSFSATPQGIIPPISQIVPPISQIVPPIFGGVAKPALPVNPSQVVPPQVFPPQVFPPVATQVPKLTYNYAFPAYYNTFPQYSYFKGPYTFTFPSTSFFSAPIPVQKEPAKTPEPLSTSYGPPSSAPAESSAPFEPSGPVENSAPFEPSPVSFPYEPAVSESPEAAPYKPAQEYGPPSKK